MARRRPCTTAGCKNTTTSRQPDAKCRPCWRARGRGADGGEKILPLCKVCHKNPTTSRSEDGVCRPCYDGRRVQVQNGVAPDDVGATFERDQMVERLKGDAAIYKKAYRETVKERAEEERLIGLFDQSIRRFPALPSGAFDVKAAKPSESRTPEVPVLLLGDQQIGEVIRSEETHGINRYDFGVYQARLEYLEDRTVDILTHHQRGTFEEMVVLSMGDNVSGVIHDELQKYGHQHIIDQVYLGALTSALFMYRLLARLRPRGVKKLRVSCVSGNHGRISQQKEAKQYYKNFDYLFHSMMATTLRDVPQIEFHIPRCLFTVVDVANHRILQSHGHELPPSSLGIPLYSINRASAGYQELLSWSDSTRFDYWMLAHFHRPMELDNAIVNGTIAGIGEFGLGRFKPIRPMQKLLGFHPKYGQAWEYKIRLDQAPERPKVYTFEPDMETGDAIELFDARRKASA